MGTERHMVQGTSRSMIQDAIQSVQLQVGGQPPVTVQLSAVPIGIGRDRSSSLILADNKVSRRHAQMVLENGRPFIRDLESSNGTWVNGVRLAPGSAHPVSNGDVIGIGPVQLQLSTGPQPTAISSPSKPVAIESPSPQTFGAPRRSSPPSRVVSVLVAATLVVFGTLIVAAVVTWLLSPPAISVLILGSDARPSELSAGDRGRTDTLVTYIADREAGRNIMLSVPRDLWVPTSTTTSAKINTVYRSSGADGARRAVSTALGVPIDHYLVIGLQGVREVVDALGGIDVDVELDIRDDQYPTDDFGVTVFEISAGKHHLDGETALRLARTRHGDDDIARIGRQQRVMNGIRAAASNPLNIWRLPGALAAAQRTTSTDLGPRELATIVSAYVISPSTPERLAPTWNMVQPFTTPQGEAALRAQPAFRDGVAALLIGPGASVEVLNAGGRDGTARRAADTLIAHGVPVGNVGTAPRAQAESVIQVRASMRLAGQAVAPFLGLGPTALQVTSDLPGDVDVRVVLGAGYTAS